MDKTWDLIIFSIIQIISDEFTTDKKYMIKKYFSNTKNIYITVVWVNFKCMIVLDIFNKSGG